MSPIYDWLSDDTGQEAELLRDGTVQCGAIIHAYNTGDARNLWSWGCRCGAWDDGGTCGREATRHDYREHKKQCPLEMGLTWSPTKERWERTTEQEQDE